MSNLLKRSKLSLKAKIKTGKNARLFVHTINEFEKNTDLIVKERIQSGEVSFDYKNFTEEENGEREKG